MKFPKLLAVMFIAGISCFAVKAQRAEMTVTLNEPFFDALLETVFTNFDPPEFSIAQLKTETRESQTGNAFLPIGAARWLTTSFNGAPAANSSPPCSESIKILREANGVRTAVRFRNGNIYVPLAFSGSYNPMFIGCVEFSGWAETNLDLVYDAQQHRLIGQARVLNVNLNGMGGVGSSVIAKLIQGSIDKKLNPINILNSDKLSFLVPIQNMGQVKMQVTGVVPQVGNGELNIRIGYQFSKG